MNKDILVMKRLEENCPVMVTDIPSQIMREIDEWVKESKQIKNSPLAALKAHENVGYLSMDGKAHNSYQCSISPHLIEQSFWLGWVLRVTAKYWGMEKDHRSFKLRKWDGHFDGYDIWTNFAYKGDDNPEHNHAGFLSGVIYYKNHGHPTIFPSYPSMSHSTIKEMKPCEYEGKDGTMVMFPSKTWHRVEPQISNKERITLAFNVSEYAG